MCGGGPCGGVCGVVDRVWGDGPWIVDPLMMTAVVAHVCVCVCVCVCVRESE